MYYPSFVEFEEMATRGNLIPVYREILADTETPVSALMKLQKRQRLFCWKASKAVKNGVATPSSAPTRRPSMKSGGMRW
jgi:hypothetical protein